MMHSDLLEVIKIYKDLGWDKATDENVMSLPIGDIKSQKRVVSTLKTCKFGKMVKIDNNQSHEWMPKYEYHPYFKVDAELVKLLGLRMGLTPTVAVEILEGLYPSMTAKIIASKDKKYQAEFIHKACQSFLGRLEASKLGHLALFFVYYTKMPLPHHIDYFHNWITHFADLVGYQFKYHSDIPKSKLPPEVLEDRLLEHIEKIVELNISMIGPMEFVFQTALIRGWLTPNKGLELILAGLTQATRPGDRKVWLGLLTSLNLSSEILASLTQLLIPVLTLGETIIIKELGIKLISLADKDVFTEVLLACFSVKANDAIQSLLKVVLTLDKPNDTTPLIPWIAHYMQHKDNKVKRLADEINRKWQLGVMNETFIEETAIGHYWQQTPPISPVPPFEVGEVSIQNLMNAIRLITQTKAVISHHLLERILCMTHKLATVNLVETQTVIKSIKDPDGGAGCLDAYTKWGKGNLIPKFTFEGYMALRDWHVLLKVENIPVILSTPSLADFSITALDLYDRMVEYQVANMYLLSSDLFLALIRLDRQTLTPELMTKLKALKLKVRAMNGDFLKHDSTQFLKDYLKLPIQDPGVSDKDGWRFSLNSVVLPQSLVKLSEGIEGNGYVDQYTFPELQEGFLFSLVGMYSLNYENDITIQLESILNRKFPLKSIDATICLAFLKDVPHLINDDFIALIKTIWQNGLLQPGVADINHLSWKNVKFTNIVHLARVFDELIRVGMLSVIWPLLDDLVLFSMKSVRPLLGTKEIVDLIFNYLPEVKFAIRTGLTDRHALNLFGVRKLALKSGKSPAIITAQKIITNIEDECVGEDNLDVVKQVSPSAYSEQLEPGFSAIWSTEIQPKPLLEDNIEISISLNKQIDKNGVFVFRLRIPTIPDQTVTVIKTGWFYDLEWENQCMVYLFSNNDEEIDKRLQHTNDFLYWDDEKQAVLIKHTRKLHNHNKDRKSNKLPRSLLVILLVLIAQDTTINNTIRNQIENGFFNADLVLKGMDVVLQNPDVNPAKLLKMLEDNIKMLSVFWPVITKSVAFVADRVLKNIKQPVWINRILDNLAIVAPYLDIAFKQGLIAEQHSPWENLKIIAKSKSKSTAVTKAKHILQKLGIDS